MSEIGIKKKLFIALLLISGFAAFGQKRVLKVVYIGDSITQGAGLSSPATDSPPTVASDDLRKMGVDTVKFANRGISGFTTVDFLPSGDAYRWVEQGAFGLQGKGKLIFSIMLGTNDSAMKGPNGAPVPAASYFDNLKHITDNLLKDFPGCKVIIHMPIWYSPNTYNGSMYLQEGLNRLQSYLPQIKKVVAGYSKNHTGQVFVGDTDAFAYFKNNYSASLQAENGQRGIFYLHPNAAGAKVLAMFWAKAIYRVAGKKQ